jgi:hypothetical protein
VLKLNPERAVEIPEQIILVQNFNGPKTGFLSPTVWEIFVIEIGKFRILPLRFPQSASLFSVHRPNKKN